MAGHRAEHRTKYGEHDGEQCIHMHKCIVAVHTVTGAHFLKKSSCFIAAIFCNSIAKYFCANSFYKTEPWFMLLDGQDNSFGFTVKVGRGTAKGNTQYVQQTNSLAAKKQKVKNFCWAGIKKHLVPSAFEVQVKNTINTQVHVILVQHLFLWQISWIFPRNHFVLLN